MNRLKLIIAYAIVGSLATAGIALLLAAVIFLWPIFVGLAGVVALFAVISWACEAVGKHWRERRG